MRKGVKLGYVISLFFNYIGWYDIAKIAEVDFNINDPYLIIALIQFPIFIINFITPFLI